MAIPSHRLYFMTLNYGVYYILLSDQFEYIFIWTSRIISEIIFLVKLTLKKKSTLVVYAIERFIETTN